jgi:hypothetical protein
LIVDCRSRHASFVVVVVVEIFHLWCENV